MRYGIEHGQAVGAIFQVAQTQSLQTAAKPHGEAVLMLPNMRQLVHQPGAFDQGALGEIGAEAVGGEVNVAEGAMAILRVSSHHAPPCRRMRS